MAQPVKLILIDGNALLHRGYHALPPTIKNKKGEILNAVYGFSLILLNVLQKLKPEYICACFDMAGPTFRHQESETYKATRKRAPDELYTQLPRVKDVLKAFNIPIYEKKGYEADDLIATLASKEIKERGVEVIIVTGDLDALQLVNQRVKVYTLKHGLKEEIIYDQDKVKERFGIEPKQLADFKALAGDASDNIKGVKSIGAKTATQLLQVFGSLERLYKRLEQAQYNSQELSPSEAKVLKPKILQALKREKKEAFLSKKLAQLVSDVPIKFNLKQCKFSRFKVEKVLRLFQELEFNSLLSRLPQKKKEQSQLFISKKEAQRYKIIRTFSELKEMGRVVKKSRELALDLEIEPKGGRGGELQGISLAVKQGSFYLPLLYRGKRVVYSGKSPLPLLKKILEDKNIQKIAHNLKNALKVLRGVGIELKNLSFDTLLAAYLLDPGRRNYNLGGLFFTELGKRKKFTLEDEEKGGRMGQLALHRMENTYLLLQLKHHLAKRIEETGRLEEVLERIELPLVPVLARMEEEGIKIDKDYLKKMSIKMKIDLKELEEEIFKLAGVRFNVNSPKQLEEVLFQKIKLPTRGIRRTKTGYSTAQSELEKLRNKHEIISLIERFRELSKLVSTYIDALPQLIDPQTGRIHTDFNQTITATGRLSSSHPNLQNIPVRTPEGRAIRRGFIAEQGYRFLSADYSQIELRLAAHLSGDPTMLQAFLNDEDIHRRVAAEINNLQMEEVTETMRYEAKTVNFGVLYGMGVYGLARSLGISAQRAEQFIEKYFNDFPRLREYLDRTLESARKKGYVETLFGRRRYLPEINSNTQTLRAQAERMAINMPIQGLAADIIKMAMIKIDRMVIHKKDIRMLLQVHDELLFEVQEQKIKKYAGMIKEIMESIYQLKIPLKVDLKAGRNWEEMSEVG